jgi:hypothetical protein
MPTRFYRHALAAADEFLVDVGAVDLRGAEEGDPEVDRAAQDLDHGLPVAGVGR